MYLRKAVRTPALAFRSYCFEVRVRATHVPQTQYLHVPAIKKSHLFKGTKRQPRNQTFLESYGRRRYRVADTCKERGIRSVTCNQRVGNPVGDMYMYVLCSWRPRPQRPALFPFPTPKGIMSSNVRVSNSFPVRTPASDVVPALCGTTPAATIGQKRPVVIRRVCRVKRRSGAGPVGARSPPSPVAKEKRGRWRWWRGWRWWWWWWLVVVGGEKTKTEDDKISIFYLSIYLPVCLSACLST